MTESERRAIRRIAEVRASEIEELFGGRVTEPALAEYYELMTAIAIGDIEQWHGFVGYWKEIDPGLANEGKVYFLDEVLSSFERDVCDLISQIVAQKEARSS